MKFLTFNLLAGKTFHRQVLTFIVFAWKTFHRTFLKLSSFLQAKRYPLFPQLPARDEGLKKKIQIDLYYLSLSLKLILYEMPILRQLSVIPIDGCDDCQKHLINFVVTVWHKAPPPPQKHKCKFNWYDITQYLNSLFQCHYCFAGWWEGGFQGLWCGDGHLHLHLDRPLPPCSRLPCPEADQPGGNPLPSCW